MPVSRSKNLIKYVAPTILSSCAFFLFTIVDAIFLGHGVGTDALGAINLAMPFVMIVNALFMLATIGGITIAAIRFGRGDTEGASNSFMHAVTGALVIAVLLSIAGVFFTEPLTRLLGANNTFHHMVSEYLFWYSVFIIPSGLSVVLQGFARNDGAPGLVSVVVILSTVLNIFGDWLLIFPMQMGMKGAAIATGVSQTAAMAIMLVHFLRRKGKLVIGRFKPNGALFGKIAVRGLPETLAQFATPVATLCMNYILLREIGDIGVNAYSIISYAATFSVAVFMGSSEGLQPLFGQSYGAKNDEDLKYYFRAGTLINLCGSILITVALLYVGDSICALFGADAQTLAFTVEHLPQYAWGFIFMAVNTMISAYLYSTKRTKEALVLNVLHSFILNSLTIILLPSILGSGVIWYTFGIYEILVLVLAVALVKKSEQFGVVYC